jgi:hypothetical protein
MPAAQTGGHGLEVDSVRYHRLIVHCSDDDFQRLVHFLDAPGFEMISVVSPCRAPTTTELANNGTVDHKAIKIRYPAFMGMKMPPGPSADTLAAVLNVFGDSANGTKAPSGLPYKRLVAKLADEMIVNYRTAKGKLDTLLRAGHLKQEYGNVLFPKQLMIETEDRGDAEG